MDTLKNMLAPLGMNTGALQDTLVRCMTFVVACMTHPDCIQKLVVIGGTMETARRASVSAWNGFIDC
jgi:mitochondrial chaperone BCS1